MNKQEAKTALIEGKKITHSVFYKHEFVHIKDGVVTDERKYVHDRFWSLRLDDRWSNGWSIWEETKK